MRKVPATVITGFLGAGKTTLVRHLLENNGGRRIALVINEFGDIGFDSELVSGCNDAACGEDDIVELPNGCICCTVADEFRPTMQALLDRKDPPDHIIIETSGLALPKPLVKAFQWPDVRTRATVDGVVTLIDADAVAAGRFASNEDALTAARLADPNLDHDTPLEELFEDQLHCADIVVLNKTDLVSPDQLAAIEADLRKELRPGVRIIRAEHGVVDPAVLLGVTAAAEDDLASRPSHHDNVDGAHDHDDFVSFVVTGAEATDAATLTRRLEEIIRSHDVLRAKGAVAVKGKPGRLIVQAAGPRIQHFYDRPWQAGEARQSSIVVIGEKGMDQAAIEQALKDVIA